jgi:hypothetical protein
MMLVKTTICAHGAHGDCARAGDVRDSEDLDVDREPDPGKRSLAAGMQREHNIRRHVVERACPLKLMLLSSPLSSP